MKISEHIRRQPLLSAVLIVLLPSSIGLIVAWKLAEGPAGYSELSKALYVESITLIFGGIIGGFLKLLFADLTLNRQRIQENAAFVSNVLNDLKSVYDRVGRVRILIPAHKSAKTYGDEMRDLIQARVTLRNVIRALDRRTEGLSEGVRITVSDYVADMERYLEKLTSEFQEYYKPIANLQRVYETNVAARLSAAGDHASVDRVFEAETVWEQMNKLEQLNGLINDAETSPYRQEFEMPLDQVSGVLREELRKIHAGETADQISKAVETTDDTEESDNTSA